MNSFYLSTPIRPRLKPLRTQSETKTCFMPLNSRIVSSFKWGISYLRTISLGFWSWKDKGVTSTWKRHAHSHWINNCWSNHKAIPSFFKLQLTRPNYFGLCPNLLWNYRRTGLENEWDILGKMWSTLKVRVSQNGIKLVCENF